MSGAIEVLAKAAHINVAALLASAKPEMPSINDFLPPEILFQGTPFAMNRIVMVRLIMAVIVMIIFGIGSSPRKSGSRKIPKRARNSNGLCAI